MKANELMVGDYVLYDNKILQVGQLSDYDIRIDLLKGDELYAQFWDEDMDNIHGIKITAEILSKCGFKKNKTGQWVIEKKHSIGCCGQTCDNTNPLEYAVWWDRFGLGCVSYLEKEGYMTLGGTTYVHQLQQVLRLFDLDKFIKIEL